MKRVLKLLPIIAIMFVLGACSQGHSKKAASSSIATTDKIAFSVHDFTNIQLDYLSHASTKESTGWSKTQATTSLGSSNGESSGSIAGHADQTLSWVKGNSRITITFAGKNGENGAFVKTITNAEKTKAMKSASFKVAKSIKLGDSAKTVKNKLGTAANQTQNQTSDGHIVNTWVYTLANGTQMTIKLDNQKIINLQYVEK